MVAKTNDKLTQKDIEAWFQEASEEMQALTPMLGFKHPNDLIKQPAVLNLIAKKIAEFRAEERNMTAAQQAAAKEKITLLAFALAEQREAAEDRLDALQEQAKLDKKLQKTTTRTRAESIYSTYEAGAAALEAELALREQMLDDLELEWDGLEEDLRKHAMLDQVANDPKHFFELSDNDRLHAAQNNQDILKNLPRNKQLIKHNGKLHLVPHGTQASEISPELAQEAREAYKAIKPLLKTLQNNARAARDNEKEGLQERRAKHAERVSQLHQDIRLLTQQLTLVHDALSQLQLQLKMGPHGAKKEPIPTPEKDGKLHSRSTKLVLRELTVLPQDKKTAGVAQKVKAEVDMLDVTAMNRSGGPVFLFEQQQLKGNMVSASVLQTTLQSHKYANKVGGSLLSEAGGQSRQHLREEERYGSHQGPDRTPEPGENSKPEQNLKSTLETPAPKPQSKPEPEEPRHELPAAFSTSTPKPPGTSSGA